MLKAYGHLCAVVQLVGDVADLFEIEQAADTDLSEVVEGCCEVVLQLETSLLNFEDSLCTHLSVHADVKQL